MVMRCAKGFTLIEVMVALAVVAVALPALLFALFQQLDGTAYLRDRPLASWVASNKLSELRLVMAHTGSIPSGELQGQTAFAERDWRWEITQSNTQLPGFVRIRIAVNLIDDESTTPLHTLIAFVAPEEPQ